ncbi:MAG TPA: chromosome segregation protein SMC, partial [Microbacterium sp.]|nr:chromosome segregation protein SMC [Microbacterium sp.]
ELDAFARTEQERHTERGALQEQLDVVRGRIAHLEAEQRSEAVDEARRVAHGLERVQERLRSLYALAGQRLSLLAEPEQSDIVEGATVTQAAIDEARAEIDDIAAGLGDAQDAAESAGRDVIRARAELDALDVDIAEQSSLV